MESLRAEFEVMGERLKVVIHNEGNHPIALKQTPIIGLHVGNQDTTRSCRVDPLPSPDTSLEPGQTLGLDLPWLRWLALEGCPPGDLNITIAIELDHGTALLSSTVFQDDPAEEPKR